MSHDAQFVHSSCLHSTRRIVDIENFAIVSEAKDHSRIAAHTCINKVIELMIEKHCHLKNFQNLDLHIWSDGCSAQFRSKHVFALTSQFPSNFNVTRYYNERHYGKGPMDGIGGCIKMLFIVW